MLCSSWYSTLERNPAGHNHNVVYSILYCITLNKLLIFLTLGLPFFFFKKKKQFTRPCGGFVLFQLFIYLFIWVQYRSTVPIKKRKEKERSTLSASIIGVGPTICIVPQQILTAKMFDILFFFFQNFN